MSHKVPDRLCPWCGAHHDAVSAPGHRDWSPKENDLTLCLDCGEWCVLTADLGSRKPTEEEFLEIGVNPAFQALRRAWVETMIEADS